MSESNNNRYLKVTVAGESGSGKTALVAALAKMLNELGAHFRVTGDLDCNYAAFPDKANTLPKIAPTLLVDVIEQRVHGDAATPMTLQQIADLAYWQIITDDRLTQSHNMDLVRGPDGRLVWQELQVPVQIGEKHAVA